MACPITKVEVNDPRFQSIKEHYEKKHYDDNYLVEALQLCREYHNYTNDWYPQTPAQFGVFTRFLNYFLPYAKMARTESTSTKDSVYSLYTTMYALYTPEQLDNRIGMLSRDFRQIVDALEKADRTNKTRAELIRAQAKDGRNGFVNIIDSIFKKYEQDYTDADKLYAEFEKNNPYATDAEKEQARKNAEYQAQEYKTIIGNKERLAALAAVRIGESEGFVVTVKDFAVDFSTVEEAESLAEDHEKKDNEDEGVDAEETSKGDRYGDFRVLKIMSGLSPRARQVITSVKKVDSKGNLIRDDLGVATYIEGRQVASVLKRLLVTSTPDSMMSDLASAQTMYPWLKGLVDTLTQNTDLQAPIYCAMKGSETTYVYSNLEKGSYQTHVANSRSVGHALAREAGNNLSGGYTVNEETSIYTGYGMLKSLDAIQKLHKQLTYLKGIIQGDGGVKYICLVDGGTQPTVALVTRLIKEGEEAGEDRSFLRLSPVDAMNGFLNANPDVEKELAELLQGMGFVIAPSDIRTIATQTMNNKGFYFVSGKSAKKTRYGLNKLYNLVDWMDKVYTRAEQIYSQHLDTTGQYLFDTTSAFNKINDCIGLAKYDELESRVVNEHKSLATVNNTNILHQVTDSLANRAKVDEDSYQEMLENDYLRYEGMSLGFGTLRQVHGWLKYLKENTKAFRDTLRVVNIAAFNHVEYAKLTRAQKLTNSLIQYLNAGHMFGNDDYSAFEYPIESDYDTAFDFILAPRLLAGIDIDGNVTGESEIIDELTNEVFIELERIASIEDRSRNDPNRIKLKVYDEQGVKFQIFPEFNDNGFRSKYVAIAGLEEKRQFVRSQVAEQLQKIIRKDIETINDSGILSNPALKRVHFGYGNYGSMYAEDGKVESLSDAAKGKLAEYFVNVFYARQQMAKIYTGGLEQFSGLIDYEKRNMYSHATRTGMYTKATWNGKQVGKETQNVAYIGDDDSKSAFYDELSALLKNLLDQKVITSRQYKSMLKNYSSIKTTDGQGLRTLESYRDVMIMSGQWDTRHELAYQRIISGRPKKSDIDVFMRNIKPVYTGYEHVEAAQGDNQKPVKLTVLHKYSEMVLLPTALAEYCLQAQSVPFQALADAQKELKKRGKKVDMFLFHSGCKVGAHSIMQPFVKDKKTGERRLKTKAEIQRYIENCVTNYPSVIHTLPYKYYGIAASTPVHTNDKIAWASQAEKVAWANIVKEHKVKVNNVVMDALHARDLYYQIKTANIFEEYNALRKLFVNTDELEKIFQEELAGKSYASSEMRYALSHLADGTFALPLYSPNIEHQVQELLSSIIKKRITKPKGKGANILQATGFGMDLDASAFDNNNALSENEKLKLHIDRKNGKNYAEAYLPTDVFDSRLRIFADKNGNIGPERLQELVDSGVIPETMLEFIAYRTPSDAEHSVIPCRIKGFLANTGGANILLPKEIMVMTGHDYDGDKMRCHFKNFNVVENEDVSDTDVVLGILGKEHIGETMSHIVVPQYDYSKTALENSREARDNARVELMFSQLSSNDGFNRVIIPGGCDETKVMAKTLFLVRAATDDNARNKISIQLAQNGYSGDDARHIVTDTVELYNALIKMDDKTLTDIMRDVNGLETPFSLTHSVDAFEYIMGGAEMIGIYALYNSAMQMLQRVDLNYIPKKTKKGKDYEVNIFGHTFGKLFEVKNHRGLLASLGLARLLNSAVDNGKDPVLGYLHQTKQMAEMTSFLFAAGLTEEEIHLIMNQPAVIELIERMKSKDSKGLASEAKEMIAHLSENVSRLGKISDPRGGEYVALGEVAKLDKDSFKRNLPYTYQDVDTSTDLDLRESQIAILQFLAHLSPAAEQLAQFIKLTRPETESGAIGTGVSSIIAKNVMLNDFRRDIEFNRGIGALRIEGMDSVIAHRDVHDGWDASNIDEVFGTQLPEVVAQNSLMIETSLDMFKLLFPQAKKSWVDLAAEIASQYKYKTIQEGIIDRVGKEMLLWVVLKNKKFIAGDPKDEQKRILIDVPKYLKDLKDRVNTAAANPGKDPLADELVGNSFLDKLTTTIVDGAEDRPRLKFTLNGPAVEGTRDLIQYGWNQLLVSPMMLQDKSGKSYAVRDLAIDLFKYNIYTNGLTYGMYEFSHFAPFSVLMSTPNFVSAMQDAMRYEWSDDDDRENFINQYYMNHWGDSKFIPWVRFSDLGKTIERNGNISIPVTEANKNTLISISDNKYVTVYDKERQLLCRVNHRSKETDELVLEVATKLAVRYQNGQIILQYNPCDEYKDITPVVAGNDSAWGQQDELTVYATGNIEAEGQQEFSEGEWNQVVSKLWGSQAHKDRIISLTKVEEKAQTPADLNNKVMTEEDAFSMLDSLGGGFDPGTMLKIVRRNEDGTITTDTVSATPNNIREARKQQVFVDLNKRLREILRRHGVGVGALTSTEALLSLAGVTDFDTATVTADGLVEMIRIANGYEGEEALPEEFAHLALEMLGHDHPLVSRLLDAVRNNPETMREAYEGMYDEYVSRYGDDTEKLVLEAAGKLVAKQLFRQQQIESSPVRRLIQRICDAIKALLRTFGIDEILDAIFGANKIASRIAREMLGGKLVDELDLGNVSNNGQLLSVQKDLTKKDDIISNILRIETKRLSILKKRAAALHSAKPSKAVEMTEAQIVKLDAALKNYKTEDAVVVYMKNSLDFLKETEKSLDNAINSGKKMNDICRKLNTVRDTLFSFSEVIDAVEKAIDSKELQDTVGLSESVSKVSDYVSKFMKKYNRLAMGYFEEMLSNVYGEHGKTVTIGKEKGRVISIHEMATHADKDISLAARWFYSMADCPDYVLIAIDDVTREAKLRARKATDAIRPELEVAMADLIRETGSRDQSFMFEYKTKAQAIAEYEAKLAEYNKSHYKGELPPEMDPFWEKETDLNKRHKTGKYISEYDAKKLSPAQKKFYDTVMKLKMEVDKYVPDTLVIDPRNIIMMRKYTYDRFIEAEGAKGKALEAWEGLKNRVMDMSDDIDYEHHDVAVDFEGNRVDSLPLKFLFKGRNESYDDMSDDVAASLMAYAGMAHEYGELNAVIGTLENAKYMASQRDVVQKTGSRTQRESIGTETEDDAYYYTKPFTVKQAQTNLQRLMDDFYQMHVYGHIRKEEGTFGKTRLSKRKVVDTVNSIVSLSQMAINLPQRIANVSTGAVQVLIETAGKGAFNAKDVAWASGVYMKESADRLAETGKTDYDNKLSLWDAYFDVHQNNGRNNNEYKKGDLSRIFNSSLLYAGLTIGEDYLASVTSLAAARNYKVLKNGKAKDGKGREYNLWDAYEVKYKDAVNKTGAYLQLRKGFTKLDGSAITSRDEMNFSKRVISMNFELQGIYNLDDRSAVQQYAFGALIIMYRKWIAPALKRRYQGVQYNKLRDEYTEGYHHTLFRVCGDILRDTKDQVTEGESATTLLNIVADIKALKNSIQMNWDKLTDYEKANIRRAMTELSIVAGLFASTYLLAKLPPDDDGNARKMTWFDMTLYSQLLRLRTEIGSQAPTPMLVDEALKILKSPFAAIGPIRDSLNVFQLMIPTNYITEVKSGKYKGHSKAYKYFRELPIISMAKKVDNFIDPTPMINYYKSEAL